MPKNRKILLPIIIFIYTLLSGCSPDMAGNTPAVSTQEDTAVPIPTDTPEVFDEQIEIELPDEIDEGQEIVFWHAWSGRMANLMEAFALEYSSENQWDTEILVESHADDRILFRDLNDGVGEDRLPDLIAAPGFILNSMEEIGISMIDLSQYIETDQWTLFVEGENDFFPNFWSEDIYSGKRLGVPVYRTAYFLFYNKSFAEDLGFEEIPVSVEAYREQICSATQSLAAQGVWGGGWIYNYNASTILSWMKAFGGELLEQADLVLSDRENNLALNFLFEIFHQDGCAWISPIPEVTDYFFERNTLTFSGKMEDIFITEQVKEIGGYEDVWMLIPYPSGAGTQTVLSEGYSLAITSGDDQKALAAWDFIRWMLRPENQARIVQESGTYPVSSSALELLDGFRSEHPEWSRSLDYLTLIESIPRDMVWITASDVISDIGWRLHFFTTKREEIPVFLEEGEILIKELGAVR